MYKLFQEMLHYRNSLGEAELDTATVADFEERYDKIMDKAEEEYEPPSDYYREGYNLFLRLRKYKESELRFLHDKKVPANNSLCERLAQVYKKKQKQATVMRSQDNLRYLCNSMSTVYMLCCSEGNTYESIAEIFRRKRPPKNKKEIKGNT